ncbi:MAG: hypothetical protein ACD_41C00303G0008 [uncultured bacterium]|nr:MAG: hypothetical protein ACD_41C00303G0008 [uncultured bacterium]HBY73749.1 hypothetical protein [Candidatus Kerfeldbacteria bacterium]
MRWFNYWVVVGGLTLLPVVSFAQIPEDSTDADATEGSTAADTDVVDFDIGENILGNPENGGSVSTGTVESLTFLSGSADPLAIVVNIINIALSFLGVISFILMAYAGFKWFTARDNEEEVTKAKDILKGTVIGLAISLTALGIAQLIFSGAVERTTATSLKDRLVAPAYAQEEEEPTYEPETLPFDPAEGALTGNTSSSLIGSITRLDLGRADPLTIVIAMVNGVLTLLGMVFLIMLIYAGILWVLARGNEEQIVKAKTILKRSVVGLAIVLGSYGLARLIFLTISFVSYDINIFS